MQRKNRTRKIFWMGEESRIDSPVKIDIFSSSNCVYGIFAFSWVCLCFIVRLYVFHCLWKKIFIARFWWLKKWIYEHIFYYISNIISEHLELFCAYLSLMSVTDITSSGTVITRSPLLLMNYFLKSTNVGFLNVS